MIAVKTQTRGNAVVLSLVGNLNIDNTVEVDREFQSHLEKKPRVVGIDCREIASIDSSGLGLFMKLKKDSARAGVELVFFNITGDIVALFDISKMSSFFNVITAEEFEETYVR